MAGGVRRLGREGMSGVKKESSATGAGGGSGGTGGVAGRTGSDGGDGIGRDHRRGRGEPGACAPRARPCAAPAPLPAGRPRLLLDETEVLADFFVSSRASTRSGRPPSRGGRRPGPPSALPSRARGRRASIRPRSNVPSGRVITTRGPMVVGGAQPPGARDRRGGRRSGGRAGRAGRVTITAP